MGCPSYWRAWGDHGASWTSLAKGGGVCVTEDKEHSAVIVMPLVFVS